MKKDFKVNLQLFADGEGQDTQSAENQETETKETNAESNTETAENQTETQEQEKTFTQAEMDKTIGERLKRERSKQPNKEEMAKFNEWKKSQQTEQERRDEEVKRTAKLEQELTNLRNEKEVLKIGVDGKFTDFVTFEVSKMEGDFADNLSNYIKNNPQYAKGTDATPSVQAGGQKVKNEAGKVDLDSLSDKEFFERKKQK